MSELFHPEVIAITPLLCAYYCSVRKRWGWFALLRGARGVLEGRRRARGGDPRAADRAARRPPDRAPHRRRRARVVLVATRRDLPAPERRRSRHEGFYADVGRIPARCASGPAFSPPAAASSSRPSTTASSYYVEAPRAVRRWCRCRRSRRCCSVHRRRSSTSSPTCPWTQTITFHYAALPSRGGHDRGGRGDRVRSRSKKPGLVRFLVGLVVRVARSRPRSRGGRRRSA